MAKASYREQLIEATVKQHNILIEALRSKTPTSLYAFNKYVLGADEGENKVELAPFHRELCNFIQERQDRKKLVLIPRMHLKSTLVTVGYTLWRIINNPSIRVLIISGTYQNAVDFVGAIEDHLTRNETLIETFGNFSKNPVEWRNDRFTLSTNRTQIGDKEPTVLGAGIDSNIVSKHFDVIIMDDIVIRENTETSEQIEKVIKKYRDVISLMETNAQLILIGTRWTDLDAYSWILNPENNQIDQYDTMIKSAMEWDGDLETALKTGEGFLSSLWPGKFDRGELYKRYQVLGPYEFSCQLLNNPVPVGEATFRREWFQYYEEEDVRPADMNTYITIDPAIATLKSSDYTAMVVSSVNQFGFVYIREIIRDRLTPAQIIDKLFNLSELYHPKKIGIEDVAYQKALIYSTKDEMRKRGRYLPIVEVKPQNRSKDVRIRGLQPLYAGGKVYHKKPLFNNRHLEDELLRFPRGTHDDIIDSLSYVLDLIAKPRERTGDEYRPRYLY